MEQNTDNHGTATAGKKYFFRLFISGMSLRSINAIENLRELCDKHLPGDFEMEIIDVYQQPELATEHQIIATPTLIKMHPAPKKTVLGDLSNTLKVLRLLDIPANP